MVEAKPGLSKSSNFEVVASMAPKQEEESKEQEEYKQDKIRLRDRFVTQLNMLFAKVADEKNAG
jgi:hypothetical protein